MRLQEIKEGTIRGRWVSTKGPENTPGFDLQQQSAGKGWKSLGFSKTKKSSGIVTVYNGTSDKKVNLDLFKLDEGTLNEASNKDYAYFNYENVRDVKALHKILDDQFDIRAMGTDNLIAYIEKKGDADKIEDVIHEYNDGAYVTYKMMDVDEVESHL